MADDLGNFVDGYTLALGNETDGRTLALGNSAGDLVDTPITTGLLGYLKNTYSPLILLGFDETSGTTAVDSSGNGNDFTYGGSFALEVPEIFSAGLGADFDGSNASANRSQSDITTTNDAYTLLVCHRRGVSAASRVFDAEGTGRFILGVTASNEMSIFDSVGFQVSGRILATDGEYLHAAVVNDSIVDLYENGLFFEQVAAAGKPGRLVNADATFGGNYSTPTNSRTAGQYFLGALFDSAHTDADQYDIAQQSGAVPTEGHYYKEVIDEELLAANECAAFHAFWETAGTQAIDVSGKGNHGTYTSSPTLGEAPVAEGFLYSADFDVFSSTCLTLSTSIDVATDNFTCAGAVDSNTATLQGLVIFGGVNNYIGMWQHGLSVRLTIKNVDGYYAEEEVTRPSGAYSFALRRDGDTVSWWVNGTKQTDIDLAGETLSSDTRHVFFSWGNNGVGNWNGRGNHLGTFDAALTDAQCARLSEGTV